MVTKKIAQCQFARLSIILEYPSIQRLLQQQFLKAWINAFSPTNINQFQAKTIPLYRLKHPEKIVYRCSLALRLATTVALSPTTIAQDLLTYLLAHPSSEQFNLEFSLELGEKGIIDCYLCDRSLSLWLDRFPELFLRFFPSLNGDKLRENPANFFPLQYTHARCCALLRLGNLDGLIEFATHQLEQSRWSWNAPNPIPWRVLQDNNEYCLISQILHVVDDVEGLTVKGYIILATQLCEAFWELERYCRIWGEVKQKTPELSQARLGLVALTQLVLGWLLQEKLQVKPFVEL